MIKYFLFCILLFVNIACTQESKVLSATDNKTINLTSLRWNADDLQELSHKMVQNILAYKKIDTSKDKTYFLSNIRNDTYDQIDTEMFKNKIISALIKSTKLNFMEKHTDTVDYFFEGKISSILKKNNATKDMFFNFNLTLTNSKTSTVVWSEDIKIRKLYKRPLISW
ncbi:MAG: Unknown protein [uncultured Sulfurovum sp.]|uniref:Penicillin-binding protein activator LpoB n=1 Tax=uncultured Sulfurovum sp. TaxID=269237 RepID=A0A6S6SWW4_9BACT|nr:MAG: Unknown protein [uncultured Sulfurovum sp.]